MYTAARSSRPMRRRRLLRGLGDFADVLPGLITAGSTAAANIASIVRGAPTYVMPGYNTLPVSAYPYGTSGATTIPTAVSTNPFGLTDSELMIGGVAGLGLLVALMR